MDKDETLEFIDKQIDLELKIVKIVEENVAKFLERIPRIPVLKGQVIGLRK